ncbi:MAG TPA: flagellar brake protein [Phycisphaerales bacterium]|nr:flagellar brake protein [Phycisphaerales bacterium]
MPANRSRNERWRESLHQIYERSGCLEFSLAPDATHTDQTPDLVWRVRLLGVKDNELLVERPSACGKAVPLQEGSKLVGVMIIGQNRWMFNTRILTRADGPNPWPASLNGLRVKMPDTVERCSRRESMRVSTAELHAPTVECYKLLEPSTVATAELASKTQILELERTGQTLNFTEASQLSLPEVGPKFTGKLVNVGGGGMGLLVDKSEASAANNAKLVWMRIDLRPTIPAPLSLVGKIVHTHMDSAQNVYAGVAFEFAFNPQHRDFVVQQVERYINTLQQKRKAA